MARVYSGDYRDNSLNIEEYSMIPGLTGVGPRIVTIDREDLSGSECDVLDVQFEKDLDLRGYGTRRNAA